MLSAAHRIQQYKLGAVFITSLLFFVITTLFTSFFVPSVQAQTPFTADNFRAAEALNYKDNNFFDHDAECLAGGFTTITGHICGTYDPTTGNYVGYNRLPNGGAIGGLNTFMVAMYSAPPTSTREYLAYVGSHFGVPSAHAQVSGSGAGVIQPVFRLWQAIRDVSYLGFILVFIVVGFMIMFRQKLNPQTVITVQSALPGLVIGLILVTFSYFIASLLIDLAFFSLQLVAGLFIQVGGNGIPNLPQLAQNGNIVELFRVFSLNPDTLSTISTPIIQSFNDSSGGITVQGIIINALGAVVPGGGAAIGGGVSGVVITILLIAVIIQMIRLVWAMLQAYIAVFVNTLFGPLFILYSTLPGRRGALSFWWRNIIGNAMIFPAVFAAVLFAGFIVGSPPDQFGSSMPLLGFPQGLLRGILAFGIVLGTPAIPKMIKQAFGVKDLGEFASVAVAGAALGYTGAKMASGFGYGLAMDRLGITQRRREILAKNAELNKSKAASTGSFKDVWAEHGPFQKS